MDATAGTWTDVEIRRFQTRVVIFKRRGQSEREAEQLAERLLSRDRDRDDRRMCIECANLRRGGGCLAASRGRIPGADRRLAPVQTVLARCEQFEWITA